MEKGRVVETAKSADIFARPEHAYTKKLMRATPRLGVSLRDLLPEEEVPASPRARGEADAQSAAGEGTLRESRSRNGPSPRPSKSELRSSRPR
jgi:peptide/nickel transport system ATP-binding protein